MRRISVITPAFNEEEHIGRCIESIRRCRYPQERVEVIVVDNGSTDETVRIAESFNVRVLVNQDRTIGGLRNLGCEVARGDIYAFVDADCSVEEDWLRNGEEELQDKSIGVVGSCLKGPPGANWMEKAWGVHLEALNGREGDTGYVNSANCFITKEAFQRAGGFSEVLKTSEDTDICERIRGLGYRVYNCRRVSAIHWRSPKTIKGFLRREIWHGLGETRRNMSRFWRSKPLILALYNVCILLAAVPAMMIWPGAWVYVLFAFLFPPGLLAAKDVIRTKKIGSLINLTILFGLYGIARTISLIAVFWEERIT